MKKAIMIGMMAAWAAGTAIAQEDVVMVGTMDNSGTSDVEVTAEFALLSSYVSRGQVRNNDFVAQSQLTVAQYGVSFNVWGNYDIGKDYQGVSSDFSEIDLSLAYTLPLNINEMALDVGLISYNYPANGSTGNPGSTTELFAKASVLSFRDYVIPSVTMFGDVDEANGVYFLFDVVAPYQISDYLAIEAGISAGWGNTSYNDYYWGDAVNGWSQDKGFNDYNFYGNFSYVIVENLSVAINMTYTMVEGGSIRSAAGRIYESKEKFWGGVNLVYDF